MVDGEVEDACGLPFSIPFCSTLPPPPTSHYMNSLPVPQRTTGHVITAPTVVLLQINHARLWFSLLLLALFSLPERRN